jgi:hypothetical protein
MRAATRAVFCLALLTSSAAVADTFYRYHDDKTGRDVFVNRLEQVPQRYRKQLSVVFESGTLANQDEVKQPDPEPQPDEHAADRMIREFAPPRTAAENTPRPQTETILWRRAAVAVADAVNAKLGRAGGKALVEQERERLGTIVVEGLVLAAVASLCAFIVWVVLIVCAFRDKQFGWAVAVFLFWPLGYLYLLLHFCKGRPLLKSVASLGYLSPTLVALWVAWKFYAWFHLVVQARGGRM